MKKIIALILAIAMLAFGLAACSGNNNDENQNGSEVSGSETEGGENETEGEGETEDGEDNAESAGITGTAEEIINALYAEKSVELALMTSPLDVANADSIKSFTGLDDASKLKEAAVSEAMIGSQAYSLVVAKVNDAADTEEVANAMLNGIDQRKWICVEADDLKVMAKDDVIVLFMVDSAFADSITSADMEAAFTAVCGGSLDLVLEK